MLKFFYIIRIIGIKKLIVHMFKQIILKAFLKFENFFHYYQYWDLQFKIL